MSTGIVIAAEPASGLTRFEIMERALLVEALRIHPGNKRKAALWAGYSHQTFYNRLRAYDLFQPTPRKQRVQHPIQNMTPRKFGRTASRILRSFGVKPQVQRGYGFWSANEMVLESLLKEAHLCFRFRIKQINAQFGMDSQVARETIDAWTRLQTIFGKRGIKL